MTTPTRIAVAGATLLVLGVASLTGASPAVAGAAPPEQLIASSEDRLFRFSSASPGTVVEVTVAEPAGFDLEAIDTRPSSQVLYGLFESDPILPQNGLRAKGGQQPVAELALATIDPATGAVGPLVALVEGPGEANPGDPVLVSGSGNFWSMDFDPVSGLARLQTADTRNLAADADTGVTAVDDQTDIVPPNNGTVRGTAYTAAGAAFGITAQGAFAGQLVRQDPIADGTLTVVGTDLGVFISVNTGFTVGTNGIAYLLADTTPEVEPGGLSARPKGLAGPNFLHVVDLQSGVAGPGASFGTGVDVNQAQIDSLTSAPVQAPATTTTIAPTTTSTTSAVSPTSVVLARTGDEETGQSLLGVGLIAAGGVALVAAARLRTRRA
jgi:hypothetical protein